MPPSALRSMSFIQWGQSAGGNLHVKRGDADENPPPFGVQAMEASLNPTITGRHMVTVVGKVFPRGEGGGLPHDLVALHHETRAVRVFDDPFAAEQGDRAVGI